MGYSSTARAPAASQLPCSDFCCASWSFSTLSQVLLPNPLALGLPFYPSPVRCFPLYSVLCSLGWWGYSGRSRRLKGPGCGNPAPSPPRWPLITVFDSLPKGPCWWQLVVLPDDLPGGTGLPPPPQPLQQACSRFPILLNQTSPLTQSANTPFSPG